MSQNKEIVLITGTSSGIGMCAAAMLAKSSTNKFKVYAAMRNPAKKEALLKKAEGCPEENLVVIQLDVCSDESVNAAVKQIMDKEGRIDHLVNNAGVGMLGVLEDQTWDDIENIYNTNVFGIFRMIRAVVPSMKKKRNGRIINISSILGLFSMPFNTVYGSSKYAVEGITECLAPQLAQFNIHVLAIEPGPVQTEFMATAVSKLGYEPKDEETKVLFDKMMANLSNGWLVEGANQTGDDVAEYVLKAIEDEQPKVHYLTNSFFERDVKIKLNDITGEESLKNAIKLLQ